MTPAALSQKWTPVCVASNPSLGIDSPNHSWQGASLREGRVLRGGLAVGEAEVSVLRKLPRVTPIYFWGKNFGSMNFPKSTANECACKCVPGVLERLPVASRTPFLTKFSEVRTCEEPRIWHQCRSSRPPGQPPPPHPARAGLTRGRHELSLQSPSPRPPSGCPHSWLQAVPLSSLLFLNWKILASK